MFSLFAPFNNIHLVVHGTHHESRKVSQSTLSRDLVLNSMNHDDRNRKSLPIFIFSFSPLTSADWHWN